MLIREFVHSILDLVVDVAHSSVPRSLLYLLQNILTDIIEVLLITLRAFLRLFVP